MQIFQRFYVLTEAPDDVEFLLNTLVPGSKLGHSMQRILVEEGPHIGTVTPKRDIFLSLVPPATQDDHTGWFYVDLKVVFGTIAAMQFALALHSSPAVLAFATDTSNAADELEPPAKIVQKDHYLLRHLSIH